MSTNTDELLWLRRSLFILTGLVGLVLGMLSIQFDGDVAIFGVIGMLLVMVWMVFDIIDRHWGMSAIPLPARIVAVALLGVAIVLIGGGVI